MSELGRARMHKYPSSTDLVVQQSEHVFFNVDHSLSYNLFKALWVIHWLRRNPSTSINYNFRKQPVL